MKISPSLAGPQANLSLQRSAFRPLNALRCKPKLQTSIVHRFAVRPKLERLSANPSAMGEWFAALQASVLRCPEAHAIFVLLAVLHGIVLLAAPSILLIGLGLWWNANTVAHNFIHQPFFNRPAHNKIFSAYLSLLLGLPQRLWRDRHLAHHADTPWRVRLSRQLVFEGVLVMSLWSGLLAVVPGFFLQVYVPGYFLGMLFCYLQGHYEHARGTTSHYGRLYNWLFFNDGFHAEHHEHPHCHWTALPQFRKCETASSRWPAVLRWLEIANLNSLEQLVVRIRWLQFCVLRCHKRAFRKLLPTLGDVKTITVVGGGIFPRTAILLQQLCPRAEITIIDASGKSIETARPFLNERVRFVQGLYPSQSLAEADLTIIPLSFIGDRAAMYRQSVSRAIFVHDWIWRRQGKGVVISWLLFKRLNAIIP